MFYYFLGLLVCFSCTSVNGQQPRPTVNISLGEIRGDRVLGKNVIEYLGIPYAQPPINESRFRPPVQLTSLPENPYVATKYKDACFQNAVDLSSYLSNAPATDQGVLLAARIGPNEDCLYLNIFTPETSSSSELKSVMVFLHGGNFEGGTGAAFKGVELAHLYDVIVVTINYRLGVFGFLFNETEEFSGNYGILDQRMALQWIITNIGEFGGNSSDITLFGEEAGGSSVHLHLLKNEEKKPFRNAILQSAQYEDGVLSKEECKDHFSDFLKKLGLQNLENLATSLADYSSQEIFTASESITWKPCVHSNIIQDFPQNLIQNTEQLHDVNILIGTNARAVSGSTLDITSEVWLYNVTENVISEAFPQLYGKVNEKIIDQMSKNYLQFYSITNEADMGLEERSSFVDRVLTDQIFKTWTQEISWETSSRCHCSVFNYLFSKEDLASGSVATLSSELPYIFGYNVNDIDLSNLMMEMWTNFAKTGNPNLLPILGDETWPPYQTYSEKCRESLKLQDASPITESHDVISRSWSFWENYYHFLGFSCSNETSNTNPSNPDDTVNVCEPSVKDTTGMNVSNEEAGIMLIVFISLTSFFVLLTIIVIVFCCILKKKLKKLTKKLKQPRGHDNPTMSELKL